MLREPFLLGTWRVDPSLNLLRASEGDVQLEPRLMKLLLVLAADAGKVVSKEVLAAQVWDDQYVTNDTVSVAIYELRKALGDSARQPMFIKTIRKSGFQLIAEVSPAKPESENTTEAQPDPEEVTVAPLDKPDPKPGPAPEHHPVDEAIASLLAHLHLPHWHLPKLPRWSWFSLALVLAALSSLVWYDRSRQKGIAVLPLAMMSDDPEMAAIYAEGMTETLITDLARNTKLRVLPRRVVLPFAKTNRSSKDIGRALGVDYLLEGGVQLLNDEVVVTLQVILVKDEHHFWSNSYRKPTRDFFRIQSEASLDLSRRFNGGAQSTPEVQQDLDAVTYHAFLQGRHLLNSGQVKDVEKAIPYFRLVLKKAPEFAPAHASLAHCYTFFGNSLSLVTASEASKLAEQHVLRGIELDPRIAELHLLHAVLLFRDQWAWAEAEAEFNAALSLHRTSATCNQWYGLFLAAMGRSEEALEFIRDALYLAPDDVEVRFSECRILLMADRWADAEAALSELAQEHEDMGRAQILLFLVRQRHVDSKLFLPILSNWVKSQERAPALYLSLQGISGERALSPKSGRSSRTKRGHESLDPMTMALINLFAGHKSDALGWLEQALRDHQGELVFLAADPLYAPLRSEPRFKSIVERIDLPQHARASSASK